MTQGTPVSKRTGFIKAAVQATTGVSSKQGNPAVLSAAVSRPVVQDAGAGAKVRVC